MKMDWDLSFSIFTEYGSDHPENVDFNAMFQDGAYIAYLDCDVMPKVIDTNRVSLNSNEIENDRDNDKWVRLEIYISNNGSLSPPWGIINGDNKLAIAQGLHRFQYAFLNKEQTIPVVLNAKDAKLLAENYGVYVEEMNP